MKKIENSIGIDDPFPMYFTFYGVTADETSSVPSSIDVTMFLDILHGSHTPLDTFESTRAKKFNIKL